jgi:P2 family phage major capsid protein
MHLNQQARAMLQTYGAQMAAQFGVTTVAEQFAITGPKESALRKKILESSAFLKMINVMDVDQIQGQVVEVGASGLHTGRKAGGRFTKNGALSGHEYKLVETDSNCSVTWDTLSIWANSGGEGEFMRLLNESAAEAFARDILRVGFNGTSVAATSDATANPNGEDINKGWQALVKADKPAQIITEDVYLDGDGGGDYKTLDAMASDLINTKIAVQFRNDPRLVVLVGADLVAAESARLYDSADRPSEKIAAQNLPFSIAGRKAIVPDFMPGKRMVVTFLSNLQVLTQRGTRHRKAKHEEDRKTFENSYLRWEGYAVGNYDCYAAFDEANVKFGPEPSDE